VIADGTKIFLFERVFATGLALEYRQSRKIQRFQAF
jgi:hypothetical protein